MIGNTEMPRRIFYIVVALCASIIMLNTLETMMRVKDTVMFDMWLADPNIASHVAGQTNQQLYSTYLTMCLSTYFVRVITPIGLALHSYYALVKGGISKMYVYLWSMLLIGTLILSIIGESFYSIFFIISGVCYVALLCVMVYIKRIINYRAML